MQVEIIKPDFIVRVKDKKERRSLWIRLIEIVGTTNLECAALTDGLHEDIEMSYFTISQRFSGKSHIRVESRQCIPKNGLRIVETNDLIRHKTVLIAAIYTGPKLLKEEEIEF